MPRTVHGANTPARESALELTIQPLFDCLEGVMERASRLIYEAGRDDECARIRQALLSWEFGSGMDYNNKLREALDQICPRR